MPWLLDDAPGSEQVALTRFRAALREVRVDVAASESRGALLLKTKHDAHLIDGRFECERMLRPFPFRSDARRRL